jgi:tetratricopeptide (TPR) repeat protein
MSRQSPLADCGRVFAFAAAVALTLALPLLAAAQMDSQGDIGNGGKNIIQGNIFLPGGRKMDRRAKITLRSVGFGEQFALSDENGEFVFRSLRDGSYTVTVDAGEEFEVVNERVDLIEPPKRRGSSFGEISTVSINLQPKNSQPAPPGTISATKIPEDALKSYGRAQQLVKDGKTDEAIAELKKALVTCPTFAAAFNELGLDYLKKKQITDAEEAFKSALKLAPDEFTPRLNYGIALVEAKDYKGGEEQLRLAVQKDGSSGMAHLYLGRSMVQLFDYNGGEKELRKAVDIGGSETVEAHRYLAAVYIEKHQPARAADELEKYLTVAPKIKDADRIKALISKLRSGG